MMYTTLSSLEEGWYQNMKDKMKDQLNLQCTILAKQVIYRPTLTILISMMTLAKTFIQNSGQDPKKPGAHMAVLVAVLHAALDTAPKGPSAFRSGALHKGL